MDVVINISDIAYYTLQDCKIHADKHIPGFYTMELKYLITFKNGDVKELHIPCLDVSFLSYLPSVYNSKANFLMGLHEIDIIGTDGITLVENVEED